MAHHEIESVFSRWLAGKARELEAAAKLTIIPVGEFPEGAPIHEDGSSEYDPKKPLVFFAVECRGKRQCDAWAAVVDEWKAMLAAQVSA